MSPVEQYAVRNTPPSVWRVLEALEALETGPEIGGAALRGAAGFGIALAKHFGKTMVFAREMGLVRCRRPAFAGELGESPTARAQWIYHISDLGRQLLGLRRTRGEWGTNGVRKG